MRREHSQRGRRYEGGGRTWLQGPVWSFPLYKQGGGSNTSKRPCGEGTTIKLLEYIVFVQHFVDCAN